MNTLILYFILANLGLAAFYLFFRLLLQKDTFFAGKRIALLVGIVMALTYPLLDLSSWIQRSDSLVAYTDVLRERLPEIPVNTAVLANEVVSTTALEPTVGIEPAVGATTISEVAPTPVQQPTTNVNKTLSLTIFDYILLIYFLTTAFLLFRITRQLLRIRNCRKHAERRMLHGQWVYVLKGCKSPFSFFNAVFMDPDAYSEKDQQDIIEHEKVHIRQVHSFDVLFSEGVCALFWINPFAWLLKRSLRENLEFLADNNLIKNGIDPKTYQYKLLQLSCHRSDANLANHFNVSQLKKRIVMMNKKRTSWKGLGKYALYLPLFAALLLTAYAWGQQFENEAKALVDKAMADSKLLAALTMDETTLLAQNTPVKVAETTPSFSVDGLAFKVKNKKAVEVVYRKSNAEKFVIPASVKHGGVSYSVTSIGDSAFMDCPSLKSITIPSTVTTIGNRAFFYCEALSSISIPSSVTSIGTRAFSGCSSLTSITIPSSVTSIGDYAFRGCRALKTFTIDENNPNYSIVDGVLFNKDRTTLIACPNSESSSYEIPSSVTTIGKSAFRGLALKSITIPSSVTTIGEYAFSGCSSLTSITIPSSVKSIEKYAFGECVSSTTLTIPSSVTSIGEMAFYKCQSLKSVSIPSSITSIREWTFGECDALTSISIPSSVTSIGDYAFGSCTSLLSVSIPSSVTSIGRNAFNRCFSLTSITIPSSVTSIGDGAFSDCTVLKTCIVDEGNPNYSSVDDVLFNKDRTKLISCLNQELTEYVIPSSVTSIGNNAFYACSALTSITIPSSVTSIGNGAFSSCSALTSITIPSSVTSIENSTFFECSSLTSLTIPSLVTSIGGYAFFECSSLTSITIPPTVTSIGAGAFAGCSGLTSITIPSSVTSIGEETFNSCSALTSISIPSTATTIGKNTFRNCSSLTSITIPSSVTSIGEMAFNDCSGLTSISIPSSVTSIGDYAFTGCSGLTSLSIPSSVTSIGQCAFMECSGLTSITIPSSVLSIANGAFSACTALKKITVDSENPNYTSVDNVLFNKDRTTLVAYLNRKASHYDIPSSVSSIANGAFHGCSVVKTIAIPQSVTSIGDDAFRNCSLTSITIPSSVTDIGQFAFHNPYSALTEIHCQRNVPLPIRIYTFINAEKKKVKLYVPKGSKELYAKAKEWGEFATILEE